jgi:hypothetical protein
MPFENRNTGFTLLPAPPYRNNMQKNRSGMEKGGRQMNKGILFSALLVAGILFCSAAAYAQYTGPGYGMGPGYGPPSGEEWNYCPYWGRSTPGWGYGMGPGMMGRGYYGMGPGMMGPGYYGMGPGMMGPGYYGMGPGMMGPGYAYAPPYYAPPSQEPEKPLGKDEAKTMVENYLKSTRNPNLKLGKIEDKGDYFQAEIVTKEGSLVNKLDIDKDTGYMQSAY